LTDAHKSTAKKQLGLIIRVGITLLACWWVVKDMNFGDVGQAFKKTSTGYGPLLWGLVIGVFICCQILLSLRWWLFMRGWEIYIDFWSTIKLAFLGLYFNNCLPGSIGGDLVRAWYVAQHTNRRMASVISVFVDRILALLGTIIIAVTAFLAVGKEEIFTRQAKSGMSGISLENWLILFIVLGILLFTVIGMLVVPSGRKLFKYILEKGLRYGKQALTQSFGACLVLIKKPYLLPESLCLTFFLQGIVVLSLWLIGRQMGIPTDWKLYFLFFPVMWVVGSIPISVAGIGIIEGGLIVLFMRFGTVPEELKSSVEALALSQRMVWIVSSLPGLVVYLFGKHLPKDIIGEFSVDEKKTIA
jgi:hypothetical protein